VGIKREKEKKAKKKKQSQPVLNILNLTQVALPA